MMMDDSGVRKRRENLLVTVKHDRSERRERGDEVSSSDEEQDMRRVEVELQGMSNGPMKHQRRNRKQNKDLESMMMDDSGVRKRRENLLATLKHNRSKRRERGDEVSSSDEELDMRRVEVELQGMSNGPMKH